MRFDLGTIAAACGGTTGSATVAVEGASIDSRTVATGQLFVAVVAERDGHEFVADAARRGAIAAMVWRGADPASGWNGADPAPGWHGADGPWPLPVVTVDDTQQALVDLGGAARDSLECPVIGITGSVGKTTTKDLAASILSLTGPVAASARSHNNELGVPLTLINAPDEATAAVVEMGARGVGHIELLCRIARPTVGVVLAVAPAHVEMFGSVEKVAEAKGELVEAVEGGGMVVLNRDDPAVWAMRSRSAARVIGFGRDGDVTATDVGLDERLRARFTLSSPWGSARVGLGVAGEHNVSNALAAATAALVTGADLDQVAEGLASVAQPPMRMAVQVLESGVTIIDDTYNANPASMRAALEALAALDARRRVAVLGLMAELGADAPAAHSAVAEQAIEAGIEVIAVGTDLYGTAPVDRGEAGRRVVERIGGLDQGVAVLVKGSRVAGLEAVVEQLTQLGAAGAGREPASEKSA